MNIVIVSPYHGGSHQAWAEGYQKSSRHQIDLLTLPARFWKWRMHGGAVTLARRFLATDLQPDLILATDMLDLTTFLALTRSRTSRVTAVTYMHENQLTYPLPQDGSQGPMRRQLGERDRHYAFVNFASMLAADEVVFNSDYHRHSFFAALPNFLKHFPEYNELGSIDRLIGKSSVLPVGIDLKGLEIRGWRLKIGKQATTQSPIPNQRLKNPQAPLILWNQRWEYDKNPAAFFEALYALQAQGVAFRLALCGQQYGKRPFAFQNALEILSDQIIHVGYASPELYRQLLWETAVTVSTAHHEFFGISILEAIYAHSFPLLPHRLSYPEIIPAQFHADCLYDSQEELVEKLREALQNGEETKRKAAELATAVSVYDWSQVAPRYDKFLEGASG